MNLSHSLEDYLEAIWIIGLKEKTVRVKDLMKYFSYKVSSINQALKTLSEENFVLHEKYGYIELTQKGAAIAQEIYEKHKILSKFLINFLGVDGKIAVHDACNMEHYISDETYHSLLSFVTYLDKTNFPIEDFYLFKNKNIFKGESYMYLSQLKSGDEGIIKKIDAPASIKQKLLSMGLSTKEFFSIEKVAPFGGPIEIKIKGYNLSLRKEEAKMIVVEKREK